MDSMKPHARLEFSFEETAFALRSGDLTVEPLVNPATLAEHGQPRIRVRMRRTSRHV